MIRVFWTRIPHFTYKYIHLVQSSCFFFLSGFFTLTLNIYTFFIPYMYMYNHIHLKQKNRSKQTQEIITILSFFIPYITIFVQAEKQIEADTIKNESIVIISCVCFDLFFCFKRIWLYMYIYGIKNV
jgi:hypothetical protein